MNARIEPLASPRSRDEGILRMLRGKQYPEAFCELAQVYKFKLFHLCLSYLRDRMQAEDALQESLLRIWRYLHQYDERRASLHTWIYQITRNQCCTALQCRPNFKFVDEIEMEHILMKERAPPDTAEVWMQGLLVLRESVDRLPEEERRVVVLYYYEGRSTREVAEMLYMPLGTVKTHLHRGRNALRKLISERGELNRQPG